MFTSRDRGVTTCSTQPVLRGPEGSAADADFWPTRKALASTHAQRACALLGASYCRRSVSLLGCQRIISQGH
eukprot:7253457-Alexandrium_andersonii.AAC.1